MEYNDYEIYIKSTSIGVREVQSLSGDYVFIGVDNENYSIHIKNNNQDYRIWASLHIDGMPAMLDGWGKLATPNSSLYWDGFQIDSNTIREFVFVENEKDLAAFSKDPNGNVGIIELKIVQEKIKWEILSSPEPLIMGFMSTGMGEFNLNYSVRREVAYWNCPVERTRCSVSGTGRYMQDK